MKYLLVVLAFAAGLFVIMPAPVAAAEECVKLSNPIGGTTCVPNDQEGGAIYEFVRLVTRYAAGLFGLVLVFMLVISGVQYTTSAGNPEAVKSAKGRIANALIGLILFILMFGLLDFIIPGHVFR
jgi:hypothetical protein